MPEDPETRRCKSCGAELDANCTEVLCTRCLLKAGLPKNDRIRSLQIRCPNCQVAIEIVADESVKEITCPSCDSCFSLLGDWTATHVPERTSNIARFELLERVGVGAFGSVWKARDPDLDRIVAIKIPRKEQLAADEAEQFLREARSAAQLHHPGIVSVHEVGREGDRIYIVSDFVEGVTLADWLTAQQPSARDAAQLCSSIAGALQHAHENGVIHRDLKPSNIMLDSRRRPHVMDFGLAKREAAEVTMTIEGRVLGTPAYMSPEQARGEGHQADARSDVYSLGVILFELLTGEKPFRGNSRMLLLQVLHDDAPGPRKLNGSVPRDLETICLKCLQKEPHRRYASARELADELNLFLEGRTIKARPVSATTRVWRWCQRKPLIAALTAMVVLSLVAGTVISSWLARDAMRERHRADARTTDANLQRARANKEAAIALQNEIRVRQENLKGRRQLYASQMLLAHQAWQDNQIDRFLELMQAQIPKPNDANDLRGSEWHFLWNLSHRELYSVPAPKFVSSAAFSSDSQKLAAVGMERLSVWNANDGTETMRIRVDPQSTNVAFRTREKELVTIADMIATVWNGSTGKKVRSVNCRAHIKALSADGERLVAGFNNQLTIWSVNDGKLFRKIDAHDGVILHTTISADGKCIATVTRDQTVRIWNVDSGKLQQTIRDLDIGDVHGVALSPGNRWLAISAKLAESTGGSSLNTDQVVLYDIADNRIGWKVQTSQQVSSLVFSSDERNLAAFVGNERLSGEVVIWNVKSGEQIRVLKGHQSSVNAIAFSADGRRIATAAGGLASPQFMLEGHDEVKVWDANGDAESWIDNDDESGISEIAYSPDGKRLAASAGKRMQIRNVETGDVVLEVPDVFGPLAFNPEGTRLVTGRSEKERVMRDAQTGEVLFELKGPERVGNVSFSPDGKYVASGGIGGSVIVCDAQTGDEVFTFHGHTAPVTYVTFSPDGHRIASADEGRFAGFGERYGDIRVWNLATRQQIETNEGLPGSVSCMDFSPNGKLLAAGLRQVTDNNGEIRIWNTDNWIPVHRLKGNWGTIGNVRFSFDGTRLVSNVQHTSLQMGQLKFWDMQSGQEVLRLSRRRPSRFDIRPDGLQIASASYDGTVELLDVRPLADKIPTAIGDSEFIGMTYCTDQTVNPGVFVIDQDGTRNRLHIDKTALLPTWSPNGKEIAFLSGAADSIEGNSKHELAFHWTLYRVNYQDRQLKRVTETPVCLFFRWSPDGKRFVFQSSYEDNRNDGVDGGVSSAIYVVNVDGSGQKRLTPVEHNDQFPAWSPDGRQIVYSSDRDGSSKIFVVDVATETTKCLTMDESSHEYPIWSPDGEEIACSSSGPKDHAGVYLIRSDGTGAKRISEFGMPEAWSPDGTKLLVSADDDGVFVVDRNGRNRRRLSVETERAFSPQFSSNGKNVIYRSVTTKDFDVWSVNLENGRRKKLARIMGNVCSFSVSPLKPKE